MWISTKTFESLVQDRSVAQGVAQTLQHQNIALHSTMDWMRTRLNQLEHERAILVENYMGVKLPVPVIEERLDNLEPRGHAFHDMGALFEDMGDDEAARQGVKWDANGIVR